ncbi:MAG TPA: hypothetical protein VL285_03590 [Bryobacteraceae bacterium]|nr:hypothetical protein [Bryobacteraceae bacterium]
MLFNLIIKINSLARFPGPRRPFPSLSPLIVKAEEPLSPQPFRTESVFLKTVRQLVFARLEIPSLMFGGQKMASFVRKNMAKQERNTQKTTGPKTPGGRDAVEFNGLTTALPVEWGDDFLQLCADLQAEWQPQNGTEWRYLEQMAVVQWKLARTDVAESLVTRRLEHAITKIQRQLARLQRSRRRPREALKSCDGTAPAAVETTDCAAPRQKPAPDHPWRRSLWPKPKQ